MSQRVGQIYVCVKDHSLWEKLYDIEIQNDWWLNAKTGREIFENVQGNVWYIDGEWSPEFGNGFVWLSGLGRFIHLLREKLGEKNCVILGSLTDINTDPFEWIYYCLGSYPEHRSVRGICGGPSICDTEAWIKWARIDLKPEELRHLSGFIEMADFAYRVSPVKRLAGSEADERRGRLFISVKNSSQWEKAARMKLSDAAFGFPKDINRRISETNGYDFILNDDWHIEYGDSAIEFPLKRVVAKLKQRLGGKECVILAECADPNVSPVYKVACCLDGSLTFKEVLAPLSNVEINDVGAWLRLAGFQFNKKKKEYMQAFPSSVFDFAKPSGAKKGSDGKEQAAVNDILNGLTFVVTGDVTGFKSRQELKQFIEARGGKMGSDVTAKTNYLITNNPDSGSSKNRKAQELGVPVLMEKDFLKLAEDSTAAKEDAPCDRSDRIGAFENADRIQKGENYSDNAYSSYIDELFLSSELFYNELPAIGECLSLEDRFTAYKNDRTPVGRVFLPLLERLGDLMDTLSLPIMLWVKDIRPLGWGEWRIDVSTSEVPPQADLKKVFAFDEPQRLSLAGKVFVLDNQTVAGQLTQLIEERGGEVKPNVGLKTDYLIINPTIKEPTAKRNRAEELLAGGKATLKMITYQEFYEMIGMK